MLSHAAACAIVSQARHKPLSAWDADFIDDLAKAGWFMHSLKQHFFLTARQEEQLIRIRDKYMAIKTTAKGVIQRAQTEAAHKKAGVPQRTEAQRKMNAKAMAEATARRMKEEEEADLIAPPKPRARIGDNAAPKLREYVQQIENLERDRSVVAEHIRDVFTVAKSQGYDTKILRRVLKLRKVDEAKRQEEEALLDTYMHALGMLPDFEPVED